MSLLDNLVTAVFSPSRQIGPYSAPVTDVAALTPFTAQVTLEEVHNDELVITEHPVEYGASITDHAYKKPAELVLKLGWSNSGIQSAIQNLTGIFSGDQPTDFNYANKIYKKLLYLQEIRIPFDVTTAKRKYSNMLIRHLSCSTEAATEHSLIITIMLRQILIAQTQVVTSTPANVQANPQSNAATTNVGVQQPSITSYVLNQDGTIGLPAGNFK